MTPNTFMSVMRSLDVTGTNGANPGGPATAPAADAFLADLALSGAAGDAVGLVHRLLRVPRFAAFDWMRRPNSEKVIPTTLSSTCNSAKSS